MLDQVKKHVDRSDEIERLLADPAVASDPLRSAALLRERASLAKWVAPWRELDSVRKQKADAHAMLQGESDPELRKMAQAEIEALDAREGPLLKRLEEMLLDTDEESSRNVIIEIRPGVGGEEAALFASELLRMYMKYAERRGWKVDLMDTQVTDLGGLKYGSLSVEGEDVYKYLRYESGTHRVQRVPATEASGRVHTSTATVAVMPQAEDVDVEINPADLQVDTFSAGGPGGQHVNKTQSAVRITHLPTGVVVACQTQRSQIQNRKLALQWLRARLYERQQEEKARRRRDLRRSQIGTGDRSEKIRTYNFHDNRITDHRITFSVHNLAGFLEGDLDLMIGKLLEVEREEKLKKLARS
ncbi:MAG: peptide chain release factor 1 [Planctomycetes bacterium]|nr:peptide chain release factor 1 [Planctomycetota bacterium]